MFVLPVCFMCILLCVVEGFCVRCSCFCVVYVFVHVLNNS